MGSCAASSQANARKEAKRAESCKIADCKLPLGGEASAAKALAKGPAGSMRAVSTTPRSNFLTGKSLVRQPKVGWGPANPLTCKKPKGDEAHNRISLEF